MTVDHVKSFFEDATVDGIGKIIKVIPVGQIIGGHVFTLVGEHGRLNITLPTLVCRDPLCGAVTKIELSGTY